MKKIFLFLLIIVSIWASVPWSNVGIPALDKWLGDYKLGLDLHGGVELDYLVDFSNTADLTTVRKNQILEDMKTILDGRVRRIGTTEPTLNTAIYGDETHIIVQIPTPSENDHLSADERQKKDEEFIVEAKSVIGQVIKIQFKEPRPDNEFQEILKQRPTIVSAIERDFAKHSTPFDAWTQKMADSYENVFSVKGPEILTIIKQKNTVNLSDTEVQALANKKNITLSDLTTFFPLNSLKMGQKTFFGRISSIKL